MLYMFATVAFMLPEQIEASTFDNAYTFYQTYENDMAFQPGPNKEGEIYYATCAKKAVTTGTKYTTVGWKVTMKYSSGEVITTLYYQLGGSNMTTVDTQEVDGYEYILYRVTLENMRNRISYDANEALKTANCTITFDACVTTKINGVIQGGMTDNGPSWGTVYTTYDGIANAAPWSEGTKETLRSYFDKSVEEIYYTVNISAGEGIDSVSGQGRYCFGTRVNVGATVHENYMFYRWTGDSIGFTAQHSFPIYGDVNILAEARKKNLMIEFYREIDSETPSNTRTIFSNQNGQTLPNLNWDKEGNHITGWAEIRNNTTTEYPLGYEVNQAWIDERLPFLKMYAVWEENSYNIVYDANGGTGEMPPEVLSYSETLTLPEGDFYLEGYCVSGWSTSASATEPEYQIGDTLDVSMLVDAQGLEYTNNGEIILYAVWDNAPIIEGEHIYVSLEDARNGLITETYLAEYVKATDVEDGEIPYGENESNSFTITNYLPADFTSFQKEGSVTETFRVIDSAGNCTRKIITVHIVDTSIYDAELIFGTLRFIDSSYYKDTSGNFISTESGGLMEDSVWRRNQSYSILLDGVLH